MKIGQKVEFVYRSPKGRDYDMEGTVVSFDDEAVCVAVREDDGIGGFRTELKFVPRSIFEPDAAEIACGVVVASGQKLSE